MSDTTGTMGTDAAATATAQPHVRADTLLGVLAGVQEQVRFADGKAALIAAFHVAIFGFMATQADALGGIAAIERDWQFWCRAILLGFYGLCAVIAFVYAVRCVIPRTGEAAPACLIHVTHVATTYGRDYARYSRDVAMIDEPAWTVQIGSQIVENCAIASEKYRLVKWAARWTVAAVILWATLLAFSSIGTARAPAELDRAEAGSTPAARVNAAEL